MATDKNKESFKDLAILAAEGRLYARTLLRTMLLQIGIKSLYEAEDGADAINVIRTVKLDLILLDWDSSVMRAQELVRTIRTSGKFSKLALPIIGISSSGESSNVHKAIELGVTDFLIRPLSPKVIEQRLLRVLFNSRRACAPSAQSLSSSENIVVV